MDDSGEMRQRNPLRKSTICLISLGDVFVHSVQSMEQVGKILVQPDEGQMRGRCKYLGGVWKRGLYIPRWP